MTRDGKLLTVLAGLIFACASAAAAEPAQLVGLWTSETTFGPELRGELKITRDSAQYRASLAGHSGVVTFGERPAGQGANAARADTVAAPTRERVAVTFGDRGGFRGALIDNERAIEGFWMQPFAVDAERPNPVGARQAFTTPVSLLRVRDGEWRGAVAPLPVTFTLQLRVLRNPQGQLTAAFRNPDFNSNGGASHFAIDLDGGSITFGSGAVGGRPPIRHSATLTPAGDALRIFWPDVGRTLDLRRQPEQSARKPYQYRTPPVTKDGWETASADAVGFDAGALERAVQQIEAADPFARRPSLIHSLLVARHGKLVLEEYFHGFDRDTPHDTRSAGKTFSSVMLGAAMMGGARIAPETPIYELLAARGPFANPDARKARITLAHLMTHSAGLACDDNNDDSPGNEGTLQTQKAEPDWWKYTLDLPMAHEPGARYAYCSANINLVGGALTTATDTWLPELFARTVARPLDFSHWHWNLTPTGEGYLGGGAWLRPRDLLKVGQAYLDGGVWRGRRIVEESWVKRSTTPVIEISPATTGLTPEEFSNYYAAGSDAYAWHSYSGQAADKVYRGYQATGNGGQLLIVVPDAQLVVVFTGGNYLQGGIWGRWGNDIVGAQLIAAIRR